MRHFGILLVASNWVFHKVKIGKKTQKNPAYENQKRRKSGWWLTYPSEKWWSSSMGLGWHPIYEMENNPFMFQTTNQKSSMTSSGFRRWFPWPPCSHEALHDHPGRPQWLNWSLSSATWIDESVKDVLDKVGTEFKETLSYKMGDMIRIWPCHGYRDIT